MILTPPQEYTNSGYRFSLLQYESLPPTKGSGLQKVKAIYQAKDGPEMTNIEVVVLKEGGFHPRGQKFKDNPEGSGLQLPSPSEWGVRGWSFRDLELAKDRYSKIGSDEDN